MPYTYKWSDIANVGQAYGKGIPLSRVNPVICDMVSADMWIEYPWKETITNSGNGTIPLLDTVQDYANAPPNIMRLTKAWLSRLDIIPPENRDLDVTFDLAVDLYPRSYVGIRAVSLQKAQGCFRLESAVNIPVGVTIELRVEYQLDPIKVASLGQDCWFNDRYILVAFEGLLYYIYKLGDDPRAGGVTTDGMGRTGYTGQLGTYKSALMRMKNAEDYGKAEFIFPGDVMGAPRETNGLNIFGNW